MHVIRLRARWELVRGKVMEQHADRVPDGAGTEVALVSLPFCYGDAWQGWDSAGGAMLRRNFHRPTGLGPDHRVTLAIQHQQMAATVWLNERLLGRMDDRDRMPRWDGTGWLNDFNRLALVLSGPWSHSAVLESVVLEIASGGPAVAE